MPIRLYNEYEALTDEGIELNGRIEQLLGSLIDEYSGFSLRDVKSIITDAG